MESIVSVRHLTKRFVTAEVLSDINLEFERGGIHGLVGRNGSGKTMLLKCICGMVPATEGGVYWEGKLIGKDIEMPQKMGALIEGPGFLEDYSAFWNLRFLWELNGKADKERIREVVELVGLDPDSKKKTGKFSMGMKQRLGIAQAIMERPNLLLLDEPMNGLDNAGASEMRNLLKKLNEEGTTILIASHMEEDIRTLCDRVTYLDQGKVLETKDFQ